MTTYVLSGSFARRRQCGEEDPCHTPIPIDATRIIYNGPNLPGTGVVTGENLNEVLQKMDDKILELAQAIALLNP